MPDWKKILCPVDFSDHSRAAMLEALQIAKREKGRVVLLHVLEASPLASRLEIFAPPETVAGRSAEEQNKLTAWKLDAEAIAPGLVIAEMLVGRSAGEIVRMAREGDFDLVVVGTHGRQGLRRLALGSVAEAVARTAPCAVLVHRIKDPAAAGAALHDRE